MNYSRSLVLVPGERQGVHLDPGWHGTSSRRISKGGRPAVLLNDRCLYSGRSGVTMYLQNLVAHWPTWQYCAPVGFCGQYLKRLPMRPRQATCDPSRVRLTPLKDIRAARASRNGPGAVGRLLAAAYDAVFRAEFGRDRYRVCFEPNYLPSPRSGRVVTTCHDLSVLEHPQWHPAGRIARWEQQFQQAIAVTSHWITVSKFTRDRMVRLLGIPESRITVIPLAARPLPRYAPELREHMRQQMRLPARYMLHVGDIQPRKNIRVLLDAYATLPAGVRSGCPLVITGQAAWGTTQFWRELVEHPMAGEVLVSGYTSDRLLSVLMQGASALLSPSKYEGFGLPILEAMSMRTPVICSNSTSFPEVAEDAAQYVDADDVDGWARSIRRAISDDNWRTRLTGLGVCRAAMFSWSDTAMRHAQLLQAMADESCAC